MTVAKIVIGTLIALSVVSNAIAKEDRDLAFEKKSLLWMQQTKQASDAESSGKLDEAEKIYKTIIADRINYNLDLSQERGYLAKIYAKEGKTKDAESLLRINISQRESEDGKNGFTLVYPLNEYADFLEKTGRGEEAKVQRDRAKKIENDSQN